jgi:hypothetical protein
MSYNCNYWQVFKKMTEIEAVRLSFLMWFWLNENPLKTKFDYPYLRSEGINLMLYKCPCCEYYQGCILCPLEPSKSYVRECAEDHYRGWHYASDEKTSRRHSGWIVNRLRKKYIELLGEK